MFVINFPGPVILTSELSVKQRSVLATGLAVELDNISTDVYRNPNTWATELIDCMVRSNNITEVNSYLIEMLSPYHKRELVNDPVGYTQRALREMEDQLVRLNDRIRIKGVAGESFIFSTAVKCIKRSGRDGTDAHDELLNMLRLAITMRAFEDLP